MADRVTCGLCDSKLNSPKILKCFHVFCYQCLKQQPFLSPTHRIQCTLCESLTFCTSDGIDGLPDYQFMDRVANEQHIIHCQMCDTSDMASSKCEDCQELMCTDCHDYHKKHNKFKNHSVISINTQKKQTVAKDGACMQVAKIEKDHDKYCRSMLEVCITCSKPVCSICMLGFHRGHKTKPLEMMALKARTSLSSASIALKSRVPLLESLLNEPVHEEKKYTIHIRDTREEIEELSKRLKLDVSRKIDEITDEYICKLDIMAQTEKAVFEAYIEHMTKSKLTIDGLLDATDNLLHSGDNVDLIKAFTELQTRLSHYDHNYGIPMPDVFEPMLKPGSFKLNNLYDAVGKIGRKEKPMTNSFIAVRQNPSSHLVDNDTAFTKIASFDHNITVDSVVCSNSRDAMLVLVDNKLISLKADGSYNKYNDFNSLQCGKLYTVPIGHSRNDITCTSPLTGTQK
ncbi:Hypothetical predicted protein [Mytilus galloprovincialis]|uniref:Uncharacterized protein n=1 Tax=Mytilus galloprovincialis TaxID=29158 RepID=A0A8B6BP19_MYTGA|nr:Hypothetical predicted protein [Mytilus galloprovincialis]